MASTSEAHRQTRAAPDLERALAHEVALRGAAANLQIDVDRLVATITQTLGRAAPVARGDELSVAESSALADAGVDITGPRAGTADPTTASAAEYALLLETALTVKQAATRLGVTPARIRQRLIERSLMGVRLGASEWRLPVWQFSGRGAQGMSGASGASGASGTLPGLSAVTRAFPAELHPLSVQTFMMTPAPDLDIEGRSTSPIEWLSQGGAGRAVAELAAGIPSAP